MKKTIQILYIILSLFLITSCSSYNYVEGKVNIVATTTMLGDLAHQIGGEKVAVTTLMGIGVDPHLYAPKAKDTAALLGSDFIVYNGLHLEGKMVDILDGLKSKKPVVEIGEHIIEKGFIYEDEEYDDVHDPHIWFDVRNWIVAAEALGEKLIEVDEENASYYEERMGNYIAELNELHQWIIEETQTKLTPQQRVLVTAHDAFQYFGKAYDFEVAAIQGISTAAEASIKDINDLIDLIIEKGVHAIFIESSVPSNTIDQVVNGAAARGHQVTVGDELFSDSLGDGLYSEYTQAIRYNVNAIINGLLGA